MADHDPYLDRLVDEEALRSYLRAELGPAEEFAVERHGAGHSNETLLLTWGDRELVLRRPPPGGTAETAHDVLREHEVMAALAGTAVPVPAVLLACEDHDVIGSDFYVMERLEGAVLRDEEPDRFAAPEHRRRLGEELVDTLAAIHGVDYRAVGLDEFGHPDGFTERQVRRWSEQLTWAFGTTADRREVPALYDLAEWLAEHAPAEHPATLVHGDYKLDNVVFGPARSDRPLDGRAADGPLDGRTTGGPLDDRTGDEPHGDRTTDRSRDGRAADEPQDGRTADGSRRRTSPELVGVLDWEMSTLGDPRTDLGWLLSFWRDPGDPSPVAPEFAARFTERPGYPTREALVERWEERTGLAFEHERFYVVLALYKLAALGEMFYARYLSGDADDPLYPLMEERVPALARRASEVAAGDRPV